MALTVSNATPGTISGVGVANPGTISGVGVAHPGTISSVGNATPGSLTSLQNAVTGNQAYINQAQTTAQNLSNGLTAPIYAPTPNISAINANATARANSTASDYYNKAINTFMQQQAQNQATQQAIKDQQIKLAQQELQNTQDANTLSGQRTTADTATKEAQAAQATDWRQTDQGGQYDIDRVAMAIDQAKSGTTGSGVAAGKQLSTQNAFNTQESRQATGDQQQQAATELAKARTFEDLATSNKLAGQAEGNKEQQANFNLSSFIQGQGQDLINKQQDLKIQEQNYQQQVQQNLVKQSYQDFFNKISNPAQKAAFAQAYGSFL